MNAMFLLHGAAQDGPYEVLPPDDGDYFIWAAPGVESRRYPDGQIAVFGPAVPYLHSVADDALYAMDDFWTKHFSNLPEPVQAARQAAMTALQALAYACDHRNSAT